MKLLCPHPYMNVVHEYALKCHAYCEELICERLNSHQGCITHLCEFTINISPVI